MIWVFVASFIVVIYPLYESREGIMEVRASMASSCPI